MQGERGYRYMKSDWTSLRPSISSGQSAGNETSLEDMLNNLHRRAASSHGVRKKEVLILAVLQYRFETRQRSRCVPIHLPWVRRRSKA